MPKNYRIFLPKIALPTFLFFTLTAVGCGNMSGKAKNSVLQSQNPPATNAMELDTWLSKGFYLSWECEKAPHANRTPSPHGSNRICSNKPLSEAGSGEYPVGSASVKELYDDAGKRVGFAFAQHISAGKSGESWYWYEKMGDTVVVDGLGKVGSAAGTICVSCHAGAGSDAHHSGHDFVYTQINSIKL